MCDIAPHSVRLAAFDTEIQIGNVAVLERTAVSEGKPRWLSRERKPCQEQGEPLCQRQLPERLTTQRVCWEAPTTKQGLHSKPKSLHLSRKGSATLPRQRMRFTLLMRSLTSPNAVSLTSEGGQAQTLPTEDSVLTFMS